MNLVFYMAPLSSATPVATVLAELSVPHERVVFDLAKGDQKKAEFLKLNPNGKVPTLVVDGTPMFEALAIMQWLADRFGVEKNLWPAFDSPARLEALSWTTWSYVSYGTLIGRLAQSSAPSAPAELKSPAHAEWAKKQLADHLAVLCARLDKGEHLLGAEFSLADLIVANVVAYSVICGASVEGHPRVARWLEGCRSRPSFKAGWD